ncbi:Flavodoxin reductases (ferredoxin-NADPH reductases) family 1 [Marinobacterium lacunae]|uniref:Flavodoxin reductases (Ferredoxin-NADPH reductases) family 1 n=1 Tax=Marinobacterium lacunae TaxID=1232683 RepID=A0A081G4M2_9GAMM
MPSPVLSELFIYPVKSGAPISLPSAWVETRGLAMDRRFMVCDPEGRFITAREEPRLLKLISTLVHDGLILSAPGKLPIYLHYQDIRDQRQDVQVWNDIVAGKRVPESVDQWLGDYLEQPVHLIYNDPDSYRVAGRTPERPVLFADGYPLLLTNEDSLQAIRDEGVSNIEMRRFRPNVVIKGVQAWAEDSWRRIAIGEVELELVKPCERCVLITRDPLTGEKHPRSEPLRTLARIHRSDDGRVCFGHNLMVTKPGLLTVGEPVTILE